MVNGHGGGNGSKDSMMVKTSGVRCVMMVMMLLADAAADDDKCGPHGDVIARSTRSPAL